MKKNIIKEITSIVIDERKELKSFETEISKQATSDEFVQMYLHDMQGILNIKTNSEFQVLAQLWKLAKFDTNEITLIKRIKEIIAEEIGITLQNVNNTLSSLKKKGLITNPHRGQYFLNPKYFFKGYLKNRPKAMRVILNYEIIEDIKKIEGKKKLSYIK